MPSPEYDLGYLQAGIPELEKYLLSQELYWPLSAGPPAGEPAYPRLTLSGLLLAQARLHARPLTSQQRDELARLDEDMDDVRSRWRSAWGRKAAQDFSARLRLWRDFLEEYRENADSNHDRFTYEVSRRVMMHLLLPDADGLPQAEIDLLQGLDKLLRAVLVPGMFVWEAELEPGFPPDTYWYLYGELRKGKR